MLIKVAEKDTNKKKIKLLAFLIVLGSNSFFLSFLILPSRALAEEDEKRFNLFLDLGFTIADQYQTPSVLSASSRTGFPLVGFEFMYDVINIDDVAKSDAFKKSNWDVSDKSKVGVLGLSLGAGLMFIEKGGEFTTTIVSSEGRTLSVSAENALDYLAIPIVVHGDYYVGAVRYVGYGIREKEKYIPIIRLFALFSLEPSFLLSAKTTFRVGEIVKTKVIEKAKVVEDITDNLESFDFGVGLGVGIEVLRFFSVRMKFIFGLTDIAKSEEVYMTNHAYVVLFGISSRLFGIPP
jgi:hypothetical protein